jgi:hypothetical protein
MLLPLRWLFYQSAGTAAVAPPAEEESSGGIWDPKSLFAFKAAPIRSAVEALLRRALTRAKAGKIVATGGANAAANSRNDASHAQARASRYLRPKSAAKIVGSRSLTARGIINLTDEELVLLLLAA